MRFFSFALQGERGEQGEVGPVGPIGEPVSTAELISSVLGSVVLLSLNTCCSSSQGDIGQPGPLGPAGKPGARVGRNVERLALAASLHSMTNSCNRHNKPLETAQEERQKNVISIL